MKIGGTEMAKKKKVNPYRIPATQGDIEKAKRDATNTAVASTWAIIYGEKYQPLFANGVKYFK